MYFANLHICVQAYASKLQLKYMQTHGDTTLSIGMYTCSYKRLSSNRSAGVHTCEMKSVHVHTSKLAL